MYAQFHFQKGMKNPSKGEGGVQMDSKFCNFVYKKVIRNCVRGYMYGPIVNIQYRIVTDLRNMAPVPPYEALSIIDAFQNLAWQRVSIFQNHESSLDSYSVSMFAQDLVLVFLFIFFS